MTVPGHVSKPARKVTKEERVLMLLADGEWHSARELSERVSHRFGSYLHTLKTKHGIEYVCELDPARPTGEMWYRYRLVDTGPRRLF